MKTPDQFSTKQLFDLFDAGQINIEQLNHLVRTLRADREQYAHQAEEYRQKYQREHIDTNRWKNRAELAEANSKYLEQALNSVRKERDAFEQFIREAQEQEPVAYCYPLDAENLQTTECSAEVYSVPVGCPDGESTFALYASPVPAMQMPKQEPFAYCFTDVNGRAKELCDHPDTMIPQDKRIVTALYKEPIPAQAAAIPKGFVLAPLEPSSEQQAVGAQAVRIDTTVINKMFTASRVYREMLSAAPKPNMQDSTEGAKHEH